MGLRADLLAYSAAHFTTNGVGDIFGLELKDFADAIATDAILKSEAGDVGGGLAFVGGVLQITSVAWGLLTGTPTTLAGYGITDALASSAYTAADVLAKLLTVDGPGSGLDADTLDGLSSASFQLASGYTAADVLAKLLTVDGPGSGLDADTLDGLSSASFQLASGYTAADVLAKLLTVDGSGSGLDADLLDGQSSAFYQSASNLTWQITTSAVDFTFALADAGKHFRHTSGSAHTWTIPPNSSVAFPVGTRIWLSNGGAGAVTIAQGAGVLLINRDPASGVGGSNAELATSQRAELVKVDTDTWQINEAAPANTLLGSVAGGIGLAPVMKALSASAIWPILGAVPDARIVGDYTLITSISGLSFLRGQGAATNFDLLLATTDGADSGALRLSGGGGISASRGGALYVYGNENATNPGRIFLVPGTGGYVNVGDPWYGGNTVQQNVAYQFALADMGGIVFHTSATAHQWTIPANATIAFPIGAEIWITNQGAGTLTIQPAAGVTLFGFGVAGSFALGQNDAFILRKINTNVWARA